MALNVLFSSYVRADSLEAPARESVAVLLPTYCEADNIESLIRQIEQLPLDTTIMVIDDSSPDGTAEIVKRLQIEYGNIRVMSRKGKLGLGTAIATGFRWLLSLDEPPDYIITMDSDYSHNPTDIVRLVNAAREGRDLVIGSRYIQGGAVKNWPVKRRLISLCANILAAVVIRRRIRDCTSGFRCYSKTYVQGVLSVLHSTTYEIQIETLRQASLRGFEIKEIPITFVDRKKGKSKLSRGEIRDFLEYASKSCLANLLASLRLRD